MKANTAYYKMLHRSEKKETIIYSICIFTYTYGCNKGIHKIEKKCNTLFSVTSEVEKNTFMCIHMQIYIQCTSVSTNYAFCELRNLGTCSISPFRNPILVMYMKIKNTD